MTDIKYRNEVRWGKGKVVIAYNSGFQKRQRAARRDLGTLPDPSTRPAAIARHIHPRRLRKTLNDNHTVFVSANDNR